MSLPAGEQPFSALPIDEHRERIGDRMIFWRSAGDAQILYVHGVPPHSEDWLPFLERTGGFALDLPGFGRDADYTMRGLARAIGQFVDHLGLETVRLAVHDWGGLALIWAMEHADRIDRLVPQEGDPPARPGRPLRRPGDRGLERRQRRHGHGRAHGSGTAVTPRRPLRL